MRKTDIEPLVVEAMKELVSDAYFATARMIISLLNGNRELAFYLEWSLIAGGCYVLKAVFTGI